MTLDERRLKLLLAVALVLVGAGVWAFVLRGADGPPTRPSASRSTAADGHRRPGDPDRVPLEGFDEVAVTVDPGDGSLAGLVPARRARPRQQRAAGLMEVTDLAGLPRHGVRVRGGRRRTRFCMRNTPTPLSIAWVAADGDGRVDHRHGAVPRTATSCPTYPPDGPYRYAIEVPQGDLDDARHHRGRHGLASAAACAATAEPRQRGAVTPRSVGSRDVCRQPRPPPLRSPGQSKPCPAPCGAPARAGSRGR